MVFYSSVIDNEPSMFGGTLILRLDKNQPSSFCVVDGQQRLLTACLFLSALRDQWIEARANDAKQALAFQQSINYLLFNKSDSFPFAAVERIKLFSRPDQKIFSAILSGCFRDKKSDDLEKIKQKNFSLTANYFLFRKLLKQRALLAGDYENILEKISRLLFVVVVCRQEKNIYSIFSSLNTTSQELSVFDLTKAETLKICPWNQRAPVEKIWHQIKLNFDRHNPNLLNSFLLDRWRGRTGSESGEYFMGLKKELLRCQKHFGSACGRNYSLLIHQQATLYLAVREKDLVCLTNKFLPKTKDKKIASQLADLVASFFCLKVNWIWPAVLALCLKYISSQSFTKRQLAAELKHLWAIGLKIRILNICPNKFKSSLLNYCADIYGRTKRAQPSFFQFVAKFIASQEEFLKQFNHQLVYGRDNELIMFLLMEISRRKNRGLVLSDPSIEHIIPLFANSRGRLKNCPARLLNTIGNLSLLDEKANVLAGNLDIKTKTARIYSASPLALDQEITALSHEFVSNPAKAILRRGRRLAWAVDKMVCS